MWMRFGTGTRPVAHGGSDSGDEVVADEMEEDWSGEAERIDAIEDAAALFNDETKILDADVAFDGAHHEAARRTQNTDSESQKGGLPRRKRGSPPEQRAESGGADDPACEAFPGETRTDAPGDFVFADESADHVLQHVVDLVDDTEVEQEP